MQEIDALTFCKFTVGLIFTLSSLSKIKSFSQYTKTVSIFRLVPEFFVTWTAKSILTLEIFVVISLFVNQVIAFWLASILLLIFSIALALAIVRNIKTSCNCFGTRDRPISVLDILRNFGFLCCSCGGGWLAATESEIAIASPSLSSGVSGLVALGFVLIWIHLSEIYHLFSDIKKINRTQKLFHL
ncbi:hypothetical protein IFO70_31570 [Phormidium tenue FACHB-886]|nr:hypothetical protein [Phormidium tenue FACHB-886]